jgi:threonine dehydrogenase-like Zn-dependent dehydrogenase
VGCKSIIGVDRIESRMKLAEELGASHSVNTKDEVDLGAAVSKMNVGEVSLAIDTTGVPALISAGIVCLGKRGRYVQVGTPACPLDQTLSIPLWDFFGVRATSLDHKVQE